MTSMEKDFTDVHKLRLCLLIPLFYTANNLHLQTQRLADRGANVLVVARKSPSHPQRSEAYGTVNITRVAPCMSGRIANYAMMLPAFVCGGCVVSAACRQNGQNERNTAQSVEHGW